MVNTDARKPRIQNSIDKELDKRQSEATSDETVSDIGAAEEESGSSGSRDEAQSPDGALDESDEIKDAGPM